MVNRTKGAPRCSGRSQEGLGQELHACSPGSGQRETVWVSTWAGAMGADAFGAPLGACTHRGVHRCLVPKSEGQMQMLK